MVRRARFPLTRRQLLVRGSLGLLAMAGLGQRSGERRAGPEIQGRRSPVTLFLCGDVMTGRGIDQVLPTPSDPGLHEPWVKDANRYVELAERRNGPIPRPVPSPYVWGDALAELERVAPDLRIVNLETAVTRSAEFWPGKGIHYRMHPDNAGCLTAAAIDCCVLANNHVLDWGYPGLAETLATLARAGIAVAGAGRDRRRAEAPAVLPAPGRGRVLVFGLGSPTSGIPPEWAAEGQRPGVSLVADLSDVELGRIAARIGALKRPGDLVVASIHWGANWGYAIPESHRRFARRLVDEAAVDVVHGHSSHHPLGIEVYRDRPILYGCGDFLNDYEGIGGKERFRGDLSLGYFATLDAATGRLERLSMSPFQVRRFRLQRPSAGDRAWLRQTLDRECRRLGCRVDPAGDALELRWRRRL